MGAPASQRAFTLVELLVSLAILSVVLVLATSSYQFYIGQWAQRADRVDSSGDRARALALVHSAIASAFAYQVKTRESPFETGRVPYFLSVGSGFRFATHASVFDPGAAVIARLSVREDGERRFLEYREWSLRERYLDDAESEWSGGQSLTLLDDVSSARFRYQGYQSFADQQAATGRRDLPRRPEPEWTPRFDSRQTGTVPVAVEVLVTQSDGFEWALPVRVRAFNPGLAAVNVGAYP